MGPCYLLGLLNIILTVNAASMVYAAEKQISFRDLARKKYKVKRSFHYINLCSDIVDLYPAWISRGCLELPPPVWPSDRSEDGVSVSHRTTSGDSPRSHGVDGWRWSFWSLRLGRGSGGGGEIAAAAACP
ncbi:hypothetical protein F3Y22_tig00111005pilonHSYRG00103 [Hibiscus syriacus]|uniref:Uncharacterized protein n=1 Tax=Hibiscus syriacus TaxID=106335 RepID=A0A6A2Z988_HIBSY|nr:hypothetical protein F3Y22_tig00111005pilonHSYRG00103 [Hibiscus syriacus]